VNHPNSPDTAIVILAICPQHILLTLQFVRVPPYPTAHELYSEQNRIPFESPARVVIDTQKRYELRDSVFEPPALVSLRPILERLRDDRTAVLRVLDSNDGPPFAHVAILPAHAPSNSLEQSRNLPLTPQESIRRYPQDPSVRAHF